MTVALLETRKQTDYNSELMPNPIVKLSMACISGKQHQSGLNYQGTGGDATHLLPFSGPLCWFSSLQHVLSRVSALCGCRNTGRTENMVWHQTVEGILLTGERLETFRSSHRMQIAVQVLIRPLGRHGWAHRHREWGAVSFAFLVLDESETLCVDSAVWSGLVLLDLFPCTTPITV